MISVVYLLPNKQGVAQTRFHLWVITGRNEVVAKVIFLHLSVILFTGGDGVSEADTPREQTLAYGQRAAGMHPTGMHSCLQ